MTPCGRRARLLPAKATGLVLMLWASSCAGAGVDEAALQRVEVDGSERTYRLYVPADAPERGLPLMIVLHGGLGNAESMEQSTGMDRVADTGHFLVAYPNGTEGAGRMKNRRTWNAGACCGIARRKRVDDVAFIARMIDQIAIRHSIDPDRVVAVGLSNGAMMAYRLACELPDRFAAVVAVAGTLAMSGCPGDGKAGGDGANAVAVYHIHGDSDQHVPFEGGRGSESVARVSHRSVAETLEIMTATRQCDAPKQATLPDGDRVSTYACRNGAPVKLRRLAGASHGWPGATGRWNAGVEASRFSASREAWAFALELAPPATETSEEAP